MPANHTTPDADKLIAMAREDFNEALYVTPSEFVEFAHDFIDGHLENLIDDGEITHETAAMLFADAAVILAADSKPRPKCVGFQIKIANGTQQEPGTILYLHNSLGFPAQVERDGTWVYYWSFDRGPIPNLCDCGLTQSAEIEAVWA